MKLVNNKKRRISIIIAIVAAVLVLAAVVALIVGIVSKKMVEDEKNNEPAIVLGVVIGVYPKTEYYVGQEFDPTGMMLQVVMSKNEESYTVDHTKLTFTGFDSSVPNDNLVVTATYKEYSIPFTVQVKEEPETTTKPTLTSIRLSDNFQTTYSLNDWNFYGPIFNNVKIICTYSDGSEKKVTMTKLYCVDLDLDLKSAGTYEMKIRYVKDGVEVFATVPITITN